MFLEGFEVFGDVLFLRGGWRSYASSVVFRKAFGFGMENRLIHGGLFWNCVLGSQGFLVYVSWIGHRCFSLGGIIGIWGSGLVVIGRGNLVLFGDLAF